MVSVVADGMVMNSISKNESSLADVGLGVRFVVLLAVPAGLVMRERGVVTPLLMLLVMETSSISGDGGVTVRNCTGPCSSSSSMIAWNGFPTWTGVVVVDIGMGEMREFVVIHGSSDIRLLL